jgi:hypothetical protein
MSTSANRHAVSRPPLGQIALSLIVLALSVVVVFVLPSSSGLRLAWAQSGTFTFTFAGDFGTGSGFTANLNKILPSGSAFFAAVGDLGYFSGSGSETGWCNSVKNVVGSTFPFEILVGNHEDDGEPSHINSYTPCLPDRLGMTGLYGVQYYFDYGSARFIMTAPNMTVNGHYYDYSVTGADRTWLLDRIHEAQAAGKWVIVADHENCIDTATKSCTIKQGFIDLIHNEHVDLLIQGHDHTYQRTKQLTCATVNSYNTACVADADDSLVKGAGTVTIVNGLGGSSQYNINSADSERNYFVKAMGGNGWWNFRDSTSGSGHEYGLVKVTVSATQLDVVWVPSQVTVAGFPGDSFSIIGGPTPTPGPTNTPTNTPLPTNTPTVGPSPTPTTTSAQGACGMSAYEAELGTIMAASVNNDAAASGGKKVVNMHLTNASVTISNVNGGTGGTCTLVIRYDNGATANGVKDLYVNNVLVQTLNFPPTGSWACTSCQDFITTVTLNAGTGNSIKIQNPSGNGTGVDLDKFTVSSASGPTPTPTNTPVSTNTPTNTPVPPTNTPTNTPIGPTNIPTNTPVPTNTPTNTPTPSSGNILTNGDIEAGTTGWSVFGAGTLTADTSIVHGGTQSLKHSGRTAAWNGPSQIVTSQLVNGRSYTTNVWVRTVTGSPTARVTLRLEAGTTTFVTLAPNTVVNSTGWTLLSGTATVSWSGTLTLARWYIETAAGTDSFYIDDASTN